MPQRMEAVAQNIPGSMDSMGSWGIADITGIENSMGSSGSLGTEGVDGSMGSIAQRVHWEQLRC